MGFTTTLTAKNQLTLPKLVRKKLGVKRGVKFDIYPTKDGFIGRTRRKSRILNFAGDLAHLDDRRPFSEIREKAQALAAEEIVKKLK